MTDQINMKQVRTWWGGRKFVMDDTIRKPKTFHEEQEDAINDFCGKWVLFSLIPATVVALLYLIPFDTGSAPYIPYPWGAPYAFIAIMFLCNLPNLAITLIRVAALYAVTGGK